jgi:hypothetical protein
MKKTYLFLGLSLLLVGCSDEEEDLQKLTLPVGEVTLQAAQPDNATISVPNVKDVQKSTSGTTAAITYANGQELSFSLNASDLTASVTSIDGTAEEVTIPANINVENATYTVNGIAVDGKEFTYLCESVKKITLPKTIASTSSTYTQRLANFPNLESVEMEAGMDGFTSINGAVYTSDMKTLVFCPKARSGEFAIANGTETILSRAFYGASKLTRIVIPASLKKIETTVFYYNSQLQVINMLATSAPEADDLSFGYYARRAVLAVPQGCVNNYKGTIGYTFFKNIEEHSY